MNGGYGVRSTVVGIFTLKVACPSKRWDGQGLPLYRRERGEMRAAIVDMDMMQFLASRDG